MLRCASFADNNALTLAENAILQLLAHPQSIFDTNTDNRGLGFKGTTRPHRYLQRDSFWGTNRRTKRKNQMNPAKAHKLKAKAEASAQPFSCDRVKELARESGNRPN